MLSLCYWTLLADDDCGDYRNLVRFLRRVSSREVSTVRRRTAPQALRVALVLKRSSIIVNCVALLVLERDFALASELLIIRV